MQLSDDVKTLIDKPNFAHLATLMADGSPQIAPVWVGREGERVRHHVLPFRHTPGGQR